MIRLKVGKTYKARDGSIVTITYKDDFGSSAYAYKGDNGNTYTDKGYHDICAKAHEWDLVEEAPTYKEDAIKLEVGKTYKDREGNLVTIVRKNANYPKFYVTYPFIGNNASEYMEDGRFREYDLYHDYDLIEEVPAIGMFGSTWTFNNLKEEQKMKLEVGKSYKNRNGDIVYIAHYWSDHVYPYGDESANTYLEDGTALQGQTSCRDLVEEYYFVESADKVKATTVEPKQQEEQTMQDQIVTLNCTLTVTTAYGEPRLEIYPKDEGWRASSVCTVLDDNFELVLPRDKIDTLYTDKLLLEVRTADEAYQKALDALDKANKFLDNL